MTFRKRILFCGDWTALFTYLGKAAGSYARGRISGGPRHTCAGVGWKLWSWSLPWKTPYEPEKQSTESQFFVCLPLRRNFIVSMIINLRLQIKNYVCLSQKCVGKWPIITRVKAPHSKAEGFFFYLVPLPQRQGYILLWKISGLEASWRPHLIDLEKWGCWVKFPTPQYWMELSSPALQANVTTTRSGDAVDQSLLRLWLHRAAHDGSYILPTKSKN